MLELSSHLFPYPSIHTYFQKYYCNKFSMYCAIVTSHKQNRNQFSNVASLAAYLSISFSSLMHSVV